jgi:hypothetical protein
MCPPFHILWCDDKIDGCEPVSFINAIKEEDQILKSGRK